MIAIQVDMSAMMGTCSSTYFLRSTLHPSTVKFYLSHLVLTHLTCHRSPLVEMAHSNVIIHGGTFNSAQGDFHIINNDDSGMHDFMSVQKGILIDDPIKDFIPF